MENTTSFNLYNDIRKRTNGEIYLAVVGPVRTGKSTFIKRFMNLLVVPEIKDENILSRTIDEMPQSATGTTIMTTEPKFIPKEAAEIEIDGIPISVRLIDCVGYMTKGATGHMEKESERMVKTPWFDYDIPFTKAAEIGTKKVITDHSTIGIVITTDGSFGEIERENYVEPEETTINQLKQLGKPFVVLLNSQKPYAKETLEIAKEISEKHDVKVIPVNCQQLKKEEINTILGNVLYEFPLMSISFYFPKWVEMLDMEHPLKRDIIQNIKKQLVNMKKVKDVDRIEEISSEYIVSTQITKKDLSTGNIDVDIKVNDGTYYETITEMTGVDISNEYDLLNSLKRYAELRDNFEGVKEALEAVEYKGYGVVSPLKKDIELGEPEVIKAGSKFGVKIKAKAPSIHMIKADILTEIAPIVGSEEQARDLIEYINTSAKESESGIMGANIFGKSIEKIVDEGIKNKLDKLSEETQEKLKTTMEKITNDSNGRIIFILL